MKKRNTKKVKFRIEMVEKNDSDSIDMDQNQSAWKRRLRLHVVLSSFMLTKSLASTKTANGSNHSDSKMAPLFRTEFRTVINELRPYLIPAPADPSILE